MAVAGYPARSFGWNEWDSRTWNVHGQGLISASLSLVTIPSGFEISLSVDHDEAAVETYTRNLGKHVKRAEITEDFGVPAADLIAGGPPCQGFSSAGPRRLGDHRNSLVGMFAEIIAKHRPRAFIFENVVVG
jgi:DNA (cytosine-5)-methyltransferase 1